MMFSKIEFAKICVSEAGVRLASGRPYAGRTPAGPPAGLRLCTVLGPGRRPTGQAVIFPL